MKLVSRVWKTTRMLPNMQHAPIVYTQRSQDNTKRQELTSRDWRRTQTRAVSVRVYDWPNLIGGNCTKQERTVVRREESLSLE